MENPQKPSLSASPASGRRQPVIALCAALSLAALSGCAADAPPPGPSLILSRLPAQQPGAAPATAQLLTPAEKRRYDEIDRQVLRDQNRAMADRATADAWARTYTPPVTVYGGYGYGYGGYGDGYGGYGYGYGYPYYGYGGSVYYGTGVWW